MSTLLFTTRLLVMGLYVRFITNNKGVIMSADKLDEETMDRYAQEADASLGLTALLEEILQENTTPGEEDVTATVHPVWIHGKIPFSFHHEGKSIDCTHSAQWNLNIDKSWNDKRDYQKRSHGSIGIEINFDHSTVVSCEIKFTGHSVTMMYPTRSEIRDFVKSHRLGYVTISSR
jgi:hypothetical protein